MPDVGIAVHDDVRLHAVLVKQGLGEHGLDCAVVHRDDLRFAGTLRHRGLGPAPVRGQEPLKLYHAAARTLAAGAACPRRVHHAVDDHLLRLVDG